MCPDSDDETESSETDHETDEFDTWLVLRKATDKERAIVLADIVGHPKGAPSLPELDYMNPSLSEETIREHLDVLQEIGVVTELDGARETPTTFYSLTDDARDLFDQNNLFPKEAWQRQYSRVQKPDEIQELEDLPRPET